MLLDSRVSTLLLVDIQEKLMPAMAEPQRVIANAAILVGAAYRLGIPVMATEQYPKGLGPTVAPIAGLIRDRDAIRPKMTFSAAADAPTMARLRQSRRSQVVLAGVEAHVCVLQTAIGLGQAGYQVFVVGDAISSRSPHNVELALRRLNLNGISIASLEMVLFEWLGRAGTDEFRELSPPDSMSVPADLVLLPGLLNDARLFDPLVAALGGAVSATVADTAADDSVGAMAARALAKAPRRFSLSGFSLGGYVAFEIMRQAPERVQRLALIDSSARPDSDALRKRRVQMLSQVEVGQFKGVTQRLLPQLIHPARLADKDLTGTIAAMAAAVGKDGFIRQQRAILSRPDSRPLLAAIKCPTAVICGADDQLTPMALSEEIAQCIAGARLTVIPACGHVAPLERPQAVATAVLEWLALPA